MPLNPRMVCRKTTALPRRTTYKPVNTKPDGEVEGRKQRAAFTLTAKTCSMFSTSRKRAAYGLFV